MRHALLVPAILLVVLVAGCDGGEDPSPTTAATATATPTTVATPAVTATEGTPSPTASAATPSSTPAAQQDPVVFYMVRDGAGRLWVEPVTDADATVTDQAVARAAYTALLSAPDRDGLVSLVPAGTTLLDVSVADGLLTLDLSGAVTTNPGAGAEAEAAFRQALAWTGAQFPTVDRVRLLVDGAGVEELWGHVDWSAPFEADPFAVSPIVVTSAIGSSGAITLEGTANTFEATFGIVVTGPDGAVVEDTFVMASCGSGCRGDWTHRLEGLTAGVHTVALTEDDPSDGEGRPPFSVTIDVRVPA